MEHEQKKQEKFSVNTPTAILVAGVLIAAAVLFTKMPPKQTAQTNNFDDTTATQIDAPAVTDADHITGNANAEVTIIEYSDLECPFCKEYHATLHSVMQKYGDKVAWVYRQYPLVSLHPKAAHEAEAAECAASIGGNDAFWKYIDLVFKSTPSNNGLDAKMLPQFATQIGLDKTKFTQCLDSGKYAQKIQNDIAAGQALKIQGTPYTVVILPGGKQVSFTGAKDLADMENVVNIALGNKQ